MGNFGAFLLGMVTPIVRRVLVALGLGMVTYGGLTLIADQVIAAVKSNYEAMAGAPLQILNMLGAGQAIGIILSAIVARAAFAAVGRIAAMSA